MPVPTSTLPPERHAAAFAANLAGVRERIRIAARRAGREEDSVRLVAVTKTVPASMAALVARSGVLDLGENRADVLETKAAELERAGLAPRWHFVGHLQRNKAATVARIATLVHSVDSVRLLETLDRHSGEAGRTLDVLAQVKLALEPSKSGLEPGELAAFLERGRSLANVRVVGLMAMGPLEADPSRQAELARDVFRRAADLARENRAAFAHEPELSLGMSGDFEIAIEEGATIVRVGSTLFENAEGAA